ncbi:DUF3742 family protein [Pseudomonas sp. lyk4-TYG-107]|uniref:DUF3742 family protein n=1 Tax=Pseudomonas sp. lyk4-TYG-107 TaxID=3040317 RepID=UPI002553FADE|nr:DUF3742 family protein [Pseudomonas sp. lyk4-TYG-107]
MTEKDQTSKASRLGEYLGRCWKGYLRNLAKLSGLLIRVGVPSVIAKICTLLLQTVAVISLLYIGFWTAVIFIVVLIGSIRYSSTENEPPNWRDGPSGFGLYDRAGTRLDPYDPDEME